MDDDKRMGAHILTRTSARAFPRTFYFLDTETKMIALGNGVNSHVLRLGYCARSERGADNTLSLSNSIVFYSKDEFMDWFTSQQKDKSHVYLIAHNIIYDASILDLFRELPKYGYSIAGVYSKGQTTIIRWRSGTRKLTMLDNGNLFGGKLEKWGKIFDIPKIKIDFAHCTRDELETYCKRDVNIMIAAWQAWLQFLAEHDCGGFRQTIGSTAFSTWRHRFMNSPVYVHKQTEVLKLERSSYHGGRVEAFHKGLLWTDKYYYLDINNMYGFVMSNAEYPTGLQGYSKALGLKRLISYLSRYAVIARVIINTDKPVYISKVNGHTAYPLGRFESVLTTQELIYGFENGLIEGVSEFAWYKKSMLFDGFVNEFYNLRLKYRSDGNSGYEQICKSLINSLYGKFGQLGIKQTIIGRTNPNRIWKSPVIHAQNRSRGEQIALGGVIYENIQGGEGYHSVPAIAAHITANARLYLWQLINRAGNENVFYCDTDSLIVNQNGYDNLMPLIENDTLGKLKIETSSPYLQINAPKDYRMSERSKIKGIRENAIQLTDDTYKQEQWIKLDGLIRQGFEFGYTSKEITKRQLREIHSGTVLPDGRIVPFEL